MAKPAYWELLRDPRWQKKRLEIMQRDEFRCQSCLDDESTLNVHHKHYIKGRSPWEYAEHELVTLCETCHEDMDELEAARKDIFSRLSVDGPYNIREGLALVAGWAQKHCGHDLGSHIGLAPYAFIQGEIASLLDVFGWNVPEIYDLLCALSGVDLATRRAAILELTSSLQQKAKK